MKKVLMLVLCIALVFGSGAIAEEPIRIAYSTNGLSNPQMAETVDHMVKYAEEKYGASLVFADADSDANTQIMQIENFIQSDVDALILSPIDPHALEDVAAEARAAGIKVVDFNRNLENADAGLNGDLNQMAVLLAEMAAEWILEHYGDEEVEWGLLDIQTMEVGIWQSETCKATMAELVPNAKMVAALHTLTLEEGVSATETLMQAHPNVKVILGCSAGAGVGANKVMTQYLMPEEYDDYAVFSIDATEEELLGIIDDEVQKGAVGNGGGIRHAEILVDMAIALVKGEHVDRIVWLPLEKITAENVDEAYARLYPDSQ